MIVILFISIVLIAIIWFSSGEQNQKLSNMEFQTVKNSSSFKHIICRRKSILLIQCVKYDTKTGKCNVHFEVKHTFKRETCYRDQPEPQGEELKTYYVGIYLPQAFEIFNNLTK